MWLVKLLKSVKLTSSLDGLRHIAEVECSGSVLKARHDMIPYNNIER